MNSDQRIHKSILYLLFTAKQGLALLLCLMLSCVVTVSSASAAERPLRIAVAANFTPVLKKLLVEFHQQTQINTQIISGATGALFLQIKHGSPIDIFIAADSIRPAQLEREHLTLAASRKSYAFGRLALLSTAEQPTLDDLATVPVRFAMANPATAPYGKAAKQTLQTLKLWRQYQPVIIQGINVNQTFAQIRSQAVPSGLVAYSQLVMNKLNGLNGLNGIIIPEHYHQPITQQLVIIKNSPNIAQAQQLSDFLLAPTTQQLISSFGYSAITQPIIQPITNKGVESEP